MAGIVSASTRANSIGMNLARAFCGAGQFDEARTYTLRVLQFNPVLGAARKLLNG